ncbi:MAG TPA: DUF2505 domain-containing protein [Mycobacterium sp.]|nr:DUF2505 domain-containing protein [Mycobacterium sp.]
MPRSFDMAAEYEGSVEQVHQAFRDEQYWLHRLADSGVDDYSLDTMEVGPDGSIDVKTTQVLRADRLPGWVHQFYRGAVRILREEKWTAITDGQASAEVIGSVPGAPASLSGKAVLRPTEKGSRLEFKVTVEVGIPLVGGKIENLIGGLVADLLIAEQRFTTGWIAENT